MNLLLIILFITVVLLIFNYIKLTKNKSGGKSENDSTSKPEPGLKWKSMIVDTLLEESFINLLI